MKFFHPSVRLTNTCSHCTKVWHGTYLRSVKSSFALLQKSGRNRRSYVSTSGGSRPSDNGGWGGGLGSLHKQFFRPFGPQFGLKLRGGGALPWIPHCRTDALSDVVRVWYSVNIATGCYPTGLRISSAMVISLQS